MKYQARVVPGKGRGKELGFPTLNLVVNETLPITHGIYGGVVEIDGKEYLGAFHFGPRPVFADNEATLEVHIIDTVIDNPPTITFTITKRIRDVHNFPSPEDLVRQIEKDIEVIKAISD